MHHSLCPKAQTAFDFPHEGISKLR
jgi:hypothetical protein